MQGLARFYSKIILIGDWFQPFLLLALRLYWGYSFFNTGLGKFNHIKEVIDFFIFLNIPFPQISAYIVATIECLGGFCLIIGLASRLAAIPLVIVTIIAILTDNIVQVLNVFNNPQDLIRQLPFNYFLTSLIIFAFGPGKFSFDYLIMKKYKSMDYRSRR